MMNWIREHKFEAHLAAFLLMVIPSILLYFINRGENVSILWGLIGIFAIGNIFAMIIK